MTWIGEPGPSTSPGGTTIRTRLGVRAGESPAIQVGAINSRSPWSLGVATSTTQPSIGTTPMPAGTIGAAVISVRSLPAQTPQARTAAKEAAMARPRLCPHRATPNATATVSAAAARHGHTAGSAFRPR